MAFNWGADDDDANFVFDDEEVTFKPSIDQRKAMMGSFEGFEDKDAEQKVGKPRAVIIGAKNVDGDVFYVVRLTLGDRAERQWYLKKHSEFAQLEATLKEAMATRGWGENGAITHMPELPPDETFGVRRRLSMLGLSDFAKKQKEAITGFLDQLLVQLPNTSAEPLVEQFFALTTESEGFKIPLEEVIVESGADVSLERMKGYWKLRGSQHVWTLDRSGRAMLNGKHRGADYDVTEKGEGAQRMLTRPDGWSVDLDKSNINLMVWFKPGHADLEWTREIKDKAEALIKKYAAKRAHVEKQKAAKKDAIAKKASIMAEAAEEAKKEIVPEVERVECALPVG